MLKDFWMRALSAIPWSGDAIQVVAKTATSVALIAATHSVRLSSLKFHMPLRVRNMSTCPDKGFVSMSEE